MNLEKYVEYVGAGVDAVVGVLRVVAVLFAFALGLPLTLPLAVLGFLADVWETKWKKKKTS